MSRKRTMQQVTEAEQKKPEHNLDLDLVQPKIKETTKTLERPKQEGHAKEEEEIKALLKQQEDIDSDDELADELSKILDNKLEIIASSRKKRKKRRKPKTKLKKHTKKRKHKKRKSTRKK